MAKSEAQSGKYAVTIRPAAHEDLKSLVKKVDKKQRKRIGKKISGLAVSPRPAGSKKLSGSDNEYRLRDGNYRILYEIDDENRIVRVGRIVDRKEAYRGR